MFVGALDGVARLLVSYLVKTSLHEGSKDAFAHRVIILDCSWVGVYIDVSRVRDIIFIVATVLSENIAFFSIVWDIEYISFTSIPSYFENFTSKLVLEQGDIFGVSIEFNFDWCDSGIIKNHTEFSVEIGDVVGIPLSWISSEGRHSRFTSEWVGWCRISNLDSNSLRLVAARLETTLI